MGSGDAGARRGPQWRITLGGTSMTERLSPDVELSRLTLGTVQLGLPYGIANQTGQPAYRQALAIIRAAYEGGVRCLDTAASYGASEETLGAVLEDLELLDGVTIVTKVKPIEGDLNAGEAYALVEASVLQSLERLRVEFIPICLMHWEDNFRYFEALRELQERDLVGHVGCSVMTPAATEAILASGLVDAIQVPGSVLDSRFVAPGGISQRAAEQGVAVFLRSIYLQGLVYLAEDQIPPELGDVIAPRRRLQEIAAEQGMTMAELCLRYALGLDGVASVVVGVETPEQMAQNLKLCAAGPLGDDLMARVAEAVPQLPDIVVMPTLWPKK